MTISARAVLAAAGNFAVQTTTTPRRIDVDDPSSALAVCFVQEVQEHFAKVEPDYEAPIDSVFAVAKVHGLVATIDHCDEGYWTKKKQIELLEDEDLEGPFEIEMFKLTTNRGCVSACVFKMAWPDLRRVALVLPKARRRK
jgi:hypothetical protein